MEHEMIILKCTNCGKEIQIPSDLEEFSCLFCGAKHRMSDLLPPTMTADEADRACAEEHLFDCIRYYPDYYKRFTRKKYRAAYEEHREGIREAFEALDRWVCAQPARREAILDEFTDLFLIRWEDFHAAHKTAKHRASRKRQEFADKLTLAWFTVPAVRSFGLSVSEDFCRLLRDKFVARYPDNLFELATYDDIKGGFRKHGFCFVTTAVCEAEGKPDDCAELTTFRSFRDQWMARTEAGRDLIEEYYELAPAVVAAMRWGDDESARCAQLRRDYLTPCYEALQRGDNEACLERYVQMMQKLRKRYGI